ncbi:heparinase II/III domain-containing protein [Aggregatilinea lenta]|uniref:heparinase II/III domain-containing protein n=1 Tax=Aggregatilinea lenta TaxID=913108 RepID=UPI000E5A45D4|nr:heparinase II/III family protein [Aggregatilinea lenta]
MQQPTKDQLKAWVSAPRPVEDLRAAVRQSPTTPVFLAGLRQVIPDVTAIPTLTYTLYREFERTGERPSFETPYFLKRAMFTRAVLELMLGDDSMRDAVHDLAWSICEETSWVMPAHEEQGPAIWELNPPTIRTMPFGAHTALTREPDAIDLFAAETGASLAEAMFLVGDLIAPEVRQRIRQEVERRIFKPYLAHGRDHWWFKGALNWNGVCNGSIGLAFLRLETDPETLAQALSMVLEGFAAYVATGFEPDGGSIEGVGYWNYGLMYFVAVAELLRDITGGELDILAQPEMRPIAAYAPGMVLVPPDRFINFGDATEVLAVSAGVVNRLADRTGVEALRGLLAMSKDAHAVEAETRATEAVVVRQSANYYSKLAVDMRAMAWWDATQPVPSLELSDFTLPVCGVVKMVGQTAAGVPVVLAAKAGHNDGHHSHTDVGSFIYNVGGESLIPDAGRGKYSKHYFRQQRYTNPFNNSLGHNVPRIAGQLQAPGPEFGGTQQFHGELVEHGQRNGTKFAVIDFHKAYDVPALTGARRTVELDAASGAVTLRDDFTFDGAPLEIEEAFVSWFPVEVDGTTARVTGEGGAVALDVLEPAGATLVVESFEDACRANELDGVLSRLAIALPPGSTCFTVRLTPLDA